MEKGKRVAAVDVQLDLPEAIIQRIQSFLSQKQAASTAVLSKSWYNSWLTRPIVDFDERDFQSDDEFLHFVKISMERYHELNLNIESFKLWMNISDIDSSSIANELIVKAVKLGASVFNLGFNPRISEYCLPEVLFEAESLVGLSAVGCRISGLKVMCLRLKSLSLCRVCIEADVIRDLLLGCPLLEDLFLSDCEGFFKVDMVGMDKLRNLTVIRQVNEPLRWMIPLIEFEEQSAGSVTDDRPNVSEFGKLTYLLLERVKINEMLFCDFSSKFPCIRDLTVHHCDGCVRFDISSHSISYVSLAHTKKLEIQLHVPKIRSFTFSGAIIPSLSLLTVSTEWKSDIKFSCWKNLGVSWFLELKELLKVLSLSKITLCVQLLREQHIDRLPDNIEDFHRPVVENLRLRVHSPSVCDDLLNGIFWSFQPQIITQSLFPVLYDKCGKTSTELRQPGYWQASNELLRLLTIKLDLKSSSSSCSNSHEKFFGWHELEEVNAEIFENTQKKWRPLPWETLLDALINSEKEVQIRFRLRWGQLVYTGPSPGQLI